MTSVSSFTVQVPATTANLGPGFDSFGLALALYNRFHVQLADFDSLTIATGTCVDTEALDLTPANNLLFQAIDAFFDHLHVDRTKGLAIAIEGHIPLSRGLGSSSTAIVGGLVAANHLAGSPYSVHRLLQLATHLEGHPDNVAPALLGGALLCDESLDSAALVQTYPLPWPADWQVVVAVPPYPLSTAKARQVMPGSYGTADAVFNLRKASLLTYALCQADPLAMRAALHDQLHQPYRIPLIQDYKTLYQATMAAGALGMTISGAGPTMAIYYESAIEGDLRDHLAQACDNNPALGKLWWLKRDTTGARVL
jgi:homoserine kinase